MPSKKANTERAAAEAAPTPDPAKTSKTATLIALLSRPGGADLAELMQATGWQAHSVRGALAGALKKKGYAVVSAKLDGVRRYTVAATGQGAAQ